MMKRTIKRYGLMIAPVSIASILGAGVAFATDDDSFPSDREVHSPARTQTRAAPDSPNLPPSDAMALMKDLDKNEDSFVSKQEAQGVERVASIFDSADANDDDRLSVAELSEGLRS
jgi:hypothetical protein